MQLRLLSLAGIFVCLFIAWLLSSNRKSFPVRIVLWGLFLQTALAFLVFAVPYGYVFFQQIGDGLTGFLRFANTGAEMMFGKLLDNSTIPTVGFQFALQITSTIVFFSAIMSLLYRLGIMQKIVYAVAWVMNKTMRTSGAESLSAAANIFLGQTEAPIVIRRYLPQCSRSEIHAIMVGGFATIAGSVMGVYIGFGINARDILVASLLSAPGGLLLSKIVFPPDGTEHTLESLGQTKYEVEGTIVESITNGARDGMLLAINVVAMLLAFVSIIAVADSLFGWIHTFAPWFPTSIREFMGWICYPIGFFVGIPPSDYSAFAQLIGTKISLNEFIAYTDLRTMQQQGLLTPRTITLATFALCGFANISSIAIQIGGIGSLAPERKSTVAELGFKAMITGALTNILSACVAGVWLE